MHYNPKPKVHMDQNLKKKIKLFQKVFYTVVHSIFSALAQECKYLE